MLLPIPELAVDANRDGTIVLASENPSGQDANGNPVDVTTQTKPFQFWVNNGVDGNVAVGGRTVQDDLNPLLGTPNCQMNKVTCTRDLENFARLWMYTKGLNTAIASGKIIIGLEWDSNTGDASTGWGSNDGSPAINIYAAAPPHGSSTPTGGADYLTDLDSATDQANNSYGVPLGSVAKGQPLYLTPATFANLSEDNTKTYFLFEAAASGTGRLVITFNTVSSGVYTKIGQGGQVYMNLKDIKQFYERWTVGDGPNPNPSSPIFVAYSGGGAPLSEAQISNDRLPAGVLQGFQYSSSAPGLSDPSDSNGNKYILFVHGYNIEPWAKDTFAATALKRLYWQGYKGKFGAFQWPTTYSNYALAPVVDYDMAEYTAWLSATPLKNLLQQLDGQYSSVYVLAHSMGNVVTGEALRMAAQSEQSLLKGYVASQAAVPVQCYDPSQPTPSGFFTLLLPQNTPNIYVSWMGSNNDAAISIGNFYNANDWALSGLIWETDERTKPDSISGLYPPYGYVGDPSSPPVAEGFYNHKNNAYSLNWLALADTNGINDQYEIMAFAAQAQCHALGRIATSAEAINSTDLTSLWVTDPYNNNFKDHIWHSAEFEFSNADQNNYWHSLLNQFDLLPSP
jgi:hypothetical protein